MLARFEQSVIRENPDLVLWQVGTNSLLLDRPLSPAGERILEGLGRLKAAGADVVLIDPQFAPKVLAKVDIENLMKLYSVVAKQANVGVFHRFAVMRHWREAANIPQCVPVGGRTPHERLELCLHRQAPGRRDRRGSDPGNPHRPSQRTALAAFHSLPITI